MNGTMKLETLTDLYIAQLKDLYSAEKQLVKALPKMAKAATSEKLRAGFEKHLEETKEHAVRLEKILTSHKQTTRGPKCKAMEGLVEEGAEMIEEEADPEVRDAGLICAAQRVEHYEMAGYGCVRTFAQLIGDKEGQKLLVKFDQCGSTYVRGKRRGTATVCYEFVDQIEKLAPTTRVQLVQKTLDEEGATDKKLSDLAMSEINIAAN